MIKLVMGAVGVLVLALVFTGLALRASIAAEAEAKVVRDEALASAMQLAESLSKKDAEVKRYKRILSRVQRQSNEITAENRTLRDDIAAIARGSDPADCINTAPPPAIRMLLTGHSEAGGAGAMRPGTTAGAEDRAPDAR